MNERETERIKNEREREILLDNYNNMRSELLEKEEQLERIRPTIYAFKKINVMYLLLKSKFLMAESKNSEVILKLKNDHLDILTENNKFKKEKVYI